MSSFYYCKCSTITPLDCQWFVRSLSLLPRPWLLFSKQRCSSGPRVLATLSASFTLFLFLSSFFNYMISDPRACPLYLAPLFHDQGANLIRTLVMSVRIVVTDSYGLCKRKTHCAFQCTAASLQASNIYIIDSTKH